MASEKSARAWVTILQNYRDPDDAKSALEVVKTLTPLLILWMLALWCLQVLPILSFMLSIPIGFFMMRVMALQHDCGHFALFRGRGANIFVGRLCSIFTLTPFMMWQKMHNIHHATHGNLDGRDLGEVKLLTVGEYAELSPLGRLGYRVYRSQLFLFGFAPILLFLVQYRLPVGLWTDRSSWQSAMLTNLALLLVYGGLAVLFGLNALLLIALPALVLGATTGVITFYGHHQFEESPRFRNDTWDVHEAALEASSLVVLPGWLSWFTGNISIHHVHHLYPKIPFYRLPEVLSENPELGVVNKKSLRDLYHSFDLKLYDEANRRMVTFKDIPKVAGLSPKGA